MSLEIRDEHFHAASFGLPPDFADGLSKDFRAAEIVVVAVHAGDDRVLQAQPRDRFRHTPWPVPVDRLGGALGDGAESAAPRAQVAEQHECGGLMVPAFADVGALRTLADRVQVERPRVVGENFSVADNNWGTDGADFFFSNSLEDDFGTDASRVSHGDADARPRWHKLSRNLLPSIHQANSPARLERSCCPWLTRRALGFRS